MNDAFLTNYNKRMFDVQLNLAILLVQFLIRESIFPDKLNP